MRYWRYRRRYRPVTLADYGNVSYHGDPWEVYSNVGLRRVLCDWETRMTGRRVNPGWFHGMNRWLMFLCLLRREKTMHEPPLETHSSFGWLSHQYFMSGTWRVREAVAKKRERLVKLLGEDGVA